MRAELRRRADGYRRYVVVDERWTPARIWIAEHNVVTGRWDIEDLRGRRHVNSFGRLGRRIISACEAEFERIEREQC